MTITHLTCPKCDRNFDVENDGYPTVSRGGIRTIHTVGVFVVYDGHRLAIHPTWFFGYKIHCPYCGKASRFDVSLE